MKLIPGGLGPVSVRTGVGRRTGLGTGLFSTGGGSARVIGFAGGLGGGRLRGGGYMGGPAWQALIADLVPSRDRAKVMGLMGTVSGIVGLPGPYLGGYLYERKPDFLLLAGSIL